MKPAVKRHLDRRTFFRRAGTAAFGLGASSLVTDADLEAAPQNVQRHSIPSQLKITDLRVATIVGAPMICPIIRLDTNQGLVGWGEVRDDFRPPLLSTLFPPLTVVAEDASALAGALVPTSRRAQAFSSQ